MGQIVPGDTFDIFRLPEANEDGAISTCIPYRLDITSIGVGNLLEIRMKFSGTGKEKERLVEKHLEDSRVQIIVPIKDPEMITPGPPEWVELFSAPGIFLQRKTWDEGNLAKVVIRKDSDESTHIDMNILIVLNKINLKPDEFQLLVESEKVLTTGGSLVISEQEIKFTDEKSVLCYKAEDEDLITRVFNQNSGYEIENQGSMFHPKQIHSYNSVYRSLESNITSESSMNISYIGPDTCENLHSVVRAVNALVDNGLKVNKFFILYTQWDERSMQSLNVTDPGYFEGKGCKFDVELLRITSNIDVKSDLIISTYVTNWAFNSGKRGSAAEQYLSNILTQIKNENSMIISIDPFDEKRVARSFYQLGHQGAPTIVYQSAGLELQDSAPGGYGDIIQEREREICWVTSYKGKSQTQLSIEPAIPKPNDIALSLGVVSPTGRDAYLERLSTPMLEKYTTWTDVTTDEEIDDGVDENEDFIPLENSTLDMNSLIESEENFRIIIGGPGDGKTVLLQQLGWSNRSKKDEVTIIISARRLTRKEHTMALGMYEGDEKITQFIDIIEKECVRKYKSINWSKNLSNWVDENFRINLYVDALDEVRDIKSRTKLFSLLVDCCKFKGNMNITLSMRENILSRSFKDVDEYRENESNILAKNNLDEYGNDVIEFNLADIPVYRLRWDEKDIVDSFIPSLLHGWNMKIDSQSKNELGRFITKSTRSLNRSSMGSRIFLKNPLRAVWLVRFVYDQSVILDEMDLSEFENEILRLSVKNRFENRRLKGQLSEKILDELLDFVATISVLDYEWAGNDNVFSSNVRTKFVNLISSSNAVSDFFKEVDKRDLELFLYEDMSLLYIADDDNLAWIHENLREHAIARGLMMYNVSNSIPNSLLTNWGFTPPSIYEIFFNPEKTCSVELSDAIRRIIPNDLLITITKRWLISLNDEDPELYPINSIDLKGNDHLTDFQDIISICRDLVILLKDKRDDTNSQTQEHTRKRNKSNTEVRDLIKKVHEMRDNRNKWNEIVKQKKKIRNAANGKVKQTKANLDESSPNDDKSAKEDYKNALNEQEIAHTEVQKAAKTAQEAHELMLENNKEVDKKRAMAENSHRELRNSKKKADKYHRRYIFLIKRLNRELKKRIQYLVIDNFHDDRENSVEWINHVKDMVIGYYEEELLKNLKVPKLVHSDITVIPSKKECKIVIKHDQGGYIAGKNGKRLQTLNRILNRDFHINFVFDIIGNQVSKEEIEMVIFENLQDFKIKNPTAKNLEVSSIDFSSYNRKIVLRTKDIKELYKFNFTTHVKTKLEEKFGGYFIVIGMYMDVDPNLVKEEVFDVCDRLLLSDYLINIEVKENKKGIKGRKLIIDTTNIDLLLKNKQNITDSLSSKFGPKFQIHFCQDLPPLELKELKIKLMPLIEKFTDKNEDFILHEILIKDQLSMQGRRVLVSCNDRWALIGESGSIAKQIEEELKKEFGYLYFAVTDRDFDNAGA